MPEDPSKHPASASQVDQDGRRAELETLFAAWEDQSSAEANEPGAREAKLKLLDFGVRLRLIVSVVLILVAGYFMWKTRQEMAYWLADRQPTELGDLRARWVDEEARDVPHKLDFESNTFASAQGLVVTRAAASDARGLFFCPLFHMVVTTPRPLPEPERQRLGFTGIRTEMVPLVQRGMAFAEDISVSFSAKGRLVSGSDIPDYLEAPVRYYAESMKLDPASMWVLMDDEKPQDQNFAAVLWALAAIVPLVSLVFLLRAVQRRRRARHGLRPPVTS